VQEFMRSQKLEANKALSLLLIHIQVIIPQHSPSFCVTRLFEHFFLAGNSFLAGVTRHKYKNVGGGHNPEGTGKKEQEHAGTHVSPCVPGTCSRNTLGKPHRWLQHRHNWEHTWIQLGTRRTKKKCSNSNANLKRTSFRMLNMHYYLDLT